MLVAALQGVSWGGDHVRMDVTARGATLEFDCAHGEITEPLPAADGTFSLKGTFTPERSGPSRGDGPRTVDADYNGTIKGDTMTLYVNVRNAKEPAIYRLVKGSTGNVRKCR